jgi:nucleoside-diphosphate-sugar epimerase
MRVAVLGGTRFIGPAIVDQLIRRGHDVTVLHRGLHEPHRADVAETRLDRADEAALAGALRDTDALVDTCAYTRRDAQIAVKALPGRIRPIVLSSMDVYRAFASVQAGNVTDSVPLTEASAVREQRYLYRGKRVPELDVETYEKLDVEEVYRMVGAVVLRLPMVFGERDPLRREEFMLRRVRAGRDRIPFGTGNWLWSRGWVHDIGLAVALAAESRLSGEVLNVCESQTLTMEQWARAILEAAGYSAELVRVPDPVLPEDLRLTAGIAQHMAVDASKARRLLDWSHRDPTEAIHASVTWHLAHPPPDPDPGFSADDKALEAV